MQSVMLMAERLNLRLPVAPFVAALKDPMTYVRQRAIWALEHIGTAEARDALAICPSDPDDGIRLTAQQTMERLGRSQ